MPRLPYYNPLAPSTNQKIQNRLDDKSYTEHRRRIKTATPAIDASPPHVYPHLSAKLKKLQMESERHIQILRDNIKILQRMSDILHSKGRFSFPTEAVSPTALWKSTHELVRPGEARRKFDSEKQEKRRQRRSTSTLFSWPHPLDIIIEELEEEFENQRLLLHHTLHLSHIHQHTNDKRDGNVICPRYVKQFGNKPCCQPSLIKVAPRRTATALPHLPAKKKSSRSTCEACKQSELEKKEEVVPTLPKRKTSSRPKAAAPHRRRMQILDPDKEIREGVVLSHEFEKEFGDLLSRSRK